MKTLANQYKLIKEGKGPKDVFLKEAKRQFPNLVTNSATFNEASTILKQKGIISENYVDLQMVGNPIERKKEGYEKAFAKFLQEAEAKAEEKKPSKEVEEVDEKNYDYKDEKNPDNMIFGQIQMGYYYEMKQEKNADKTIDEIKDIVFKNLAKDPIYYTKEGQFGEDIGYTDDAPSLGPTDEPKGKYKSSGYGNLKESKILKEALNKDLKSLGADLKKFMEEKGLKVELKQGSSQPLYDPIGKNSDFAALNLQDDDLHIIVNDSKLDILNDIIKKYNLKSLQSLKQTGGWADDPKKKAQSEGEIYISSDKPQRRGKAFTLELRRFDPSTIKENKEPVNEIAIAGGLVTGGGFTSQNYMDFYGLHEDTTNEATEEDIERQKELNAELEKTSELQKDMMEEAEAPSHIEAIANAAEEAYDKGMSIKEICDFIEQHLGLKMGD